MGWPGSVYPEYTYAAQFPGMLLGHMVESILPAPKVRDGLPRPVTATKRFNEPLLDLPAGFTQWTPYTVTPRSNEPLIYSTDYPKYWVDEGQGSDSPHGRINLETSTYKPLTLELNEPRICSPNHCRFFIPPRKGNDSPDTRIHLDASTHKLNPDVFHYVQPSSNRLRDPRGRMLLDHLHAVAMRAEEKEAARRFLPISPLTPLFPRDSPSPASFAKVNANVEPRAAFDLRVDTTIDSRIVERLSRLLVPNCPPESMLAWEIQQRWRLFLPRESLNRLDYAGMASEKRGTVFSYQLSRITNF
ncbi:hypothetical protein DFP73DRAFT_615597 [Morchella snyderi]|nr:hypothetical protein DFP73DRAFT_615597 [Morchella snyderi]